MGRPTQVHGVEWYFYQHNRQALRCDFQLAWRMIVASFYVIPVTQIYLFTANAPSNLALPALWAAPAEAELTGGPTWLDDAKPQTTAPPQFLGGSLSS